MRKQLWIATLKNFAISLALTLLLLFAILLLKVEIVYSALLVSSIAATVFGVTYILSIRNPANYIGFYFGIASSAFLGKQFALMGNYDLTILYFFVFIPFQILAIRNWKKPKMNEQFLPQFLPAKKRLFFIFLFLIIIIIDFIFASFCLTSYKSEIFFFQFYIKLIFAAMIASSVLANFLMIGKWMDAWIYWLIYSVVAMGSAILTGNNFNLLLFTFFLIINTISFVAWLRKK